MAGVAPNRKVNPICDKVTERGCTCYVCLGVNGFVLVEGINSVAGHERLLHCDLDCPRRCYAYGVVGIVVQIFAIVSALLFMVYNFDRGVSRAETPQDSDEVLTLSGVWPTFGLLWGFGFLLARQSRAMMLNFEQFGVTEAEDAVWERGSDDGAPTNSSRGASSGWGSGVGSDSDGDEEGGQSSRRSSRR